MNTARLHDLLRFVHERLVDCNPLLGHDADAVVALSIFRAIAKRIAEADGLENVATECESIMLAVLRNQNVKGREEYTEPHHRDWELPEDGNNDADTDHHLLYLWLKIRYTMEQRHGTVMSALRHVTIFGKEVEGQNDECSPIAPPATVVINAEAMQKGISRGCGVELTEGEAQKLIDAIDTDRRLRFAGEDGARSASVDAEQLLHFLQHGPRGYCPPVVDAPPAPDRNPYAAPGLASRVEWLLLAARCAGHWFQEEVEGPRRAREEAAAAQIVAEVMG